MQGFTDWHSHILPGVDDGVPDMETALATLRAYEEMGVAHVWLTPHIMEDYPNTTEALRARFAELQEAWKGNVTISLAAENMLDSLFQERLEARDLLTIGNEGTHLLVETSYFNPPMDFDDMIDDIQGAGYYPVLAHPERYRYMNEADYKDLRRRGVLFQINMMSTVGMYGETARGKPNGCCATAWPNSPAPICIAFQPHAAILRRHRPIATHLSRLWLWPGRPASKSAF